MGTINECFFERFAQYKVEACGNKFCSDKSNSPDVDASLCRRFQCTPGTRRWQVFADFLNFPFELSILCRKESVLQWEREMNDALRTWSCQFVSRLADDCFVYASQLPITICSLYQASKLLNMWSSLWDWHTDIESLHHRVPMQCNH